MPIIETKYIGPPYHLINGHLETIIPSVFNSVDDVHYQREQLELTDGDFLDLDWVKSNNDKLVILSHGMEGDTNRHYMKRSAKFFQRNGWDVLAWNNRGCSGRINRLVRSYHHGTTDDISAVVNHALNHQVYKSIVLIGFSMGGSMVSKYLSIADQLNERVKGGVVFSVSCDLHETILKLGETIGLYKNKFMDKLKQKLLEKQKVHMELKDLDIASVNSFEDYHKIFTLPYQGYESMEDFYKDASCQHFLPDLQRPLLMVNALNDPLLGQNCYPRQLAEQHPLLYLETPKRGGHLGFTTRNDQESYMEASAKSFIEHYLI